MPRRRIPYVPPPPSESGRYKCVKCGGIGPALTLRGRFRVCKYCHSSSLQATDEPESVPAWYTGESAPVSHWISFRGSG